MYTETQCEDQDGFAAEVSFTQSSLDERLASSYSLSLLEDNLVLLTLQPTEDNSGTDCPGSEDGSCQDSTTGNFNFAVSFTEDNQIEWAGTSDPGLTIFTLTRV